MGSSTCLHVSGRPKAVQARSTSSMVKEMEVTGPSGARQAEGRAAWGWRPSITFGRQ